MAKKGTGEKDTGASSSNNTGKRTVNKALPYIVALIVAVIAIVVIVACMIAFNKPNSGEGETEENPLIDCTGFDVVINDDGKTATLSVNTQKEGTEIEFPRYIQQGNKTYLVTAVGRAGLSQNDKIQSVKLSTSIERIEEGAFANFSALNEIIIPSSVKYIGKNAFINCSGLTSITIPDGVTTIGQWAFSGCSGLTSVTIPNSVTEIGLGAFSGCSGLTSITIPDGVTTIENSAFSGCSGLTSVTIPDSVTEIDSSAFSGCSGLEHIEVADGNNAYRSENDCLISRRWNTLILGCKNSKIPFGVTAIGASAFYGCSGLASITIPNSVTAIGIGAFWDCSELTSITIPNSVTAIGYGAFNGIRDTIKNQKNLLKWSLSRA